jgi:peptide subunit release factor 1 (eRF1)
VTEDAAVHAVPDPSDTRWLIVLADRQRARVFELADDHLREVEDAFDPVPPRVESGGWAAARGQRHSDTVAHRHLERTADIVRRRLAAAPDAGLLVGGPERARLDLESLLGAEVRHRPNARVSVRVTAGLEEVRAAAHRAVRGFEPHPAVLDRISRSTGRSGRGFAGLHDALDALAERGVDVLLVARGLTAPGARCGRCGALSAQLGACGRCGAATEPVDDVVTAAVEGALTTGARVQVVEPEEVADLGGIAGLARHVDHDVGVP